MWWNVVSGKPSPHAKFIHSATPYIHCKHWQTLITIKLEISHAAYLMLRAEHLDTTWPVLQEYTVRPDPLNVNWSRLNLFNHSVFWLEMVPVGMSWSCVQSRHDRNTPQPAFCSQNRAVLRTFWTTFFFKFHFTLSNYPCHKKNSIMLCRSFTREWIKCQMKVTHQQLLRSSCVTPLHNHYLLVISRALFYSSVASYFFPWKALMLVNVSVLTCSKNHSDLLTLAIKHSAVFF